MATRSNGAMARQIEALFNLGVIGELTDGQLLERFATRGGEEGELAFAALVERHGPMVWRVCRSTLRDPNDAQDAFQAAFLVLVQKARSLWVRDSLGPWLHRVAHRVAVRARRDAARRLEHERRTAAARPSSAPDDRGDDDLAAMLHDEIERLPARCREPLILCDVQGLTHQDAARRLGWPLGTVKTRLARARELLRGRLSRRNGLPPGLMIAAPRLASAFRNDPAASLAILVESTVRAATAVATSDAVALKVIPPSVVTLFKEVLNAMLLTKLKIASAAVLTAVTAAGVAGAVAQSSGDGKSRVRPTAIRPMATAPTSSETESAVTKSRARIVERLEEEAEEARARLGRLVKYARTKTRHVTLNDPQIHFANEAIDDLDDRLAKIDHILNDAVKAHPNLLDFSGGRGEIEAQDDHDLEQIESNTELLRAKKRVEWAQRMFEKGYVSRSQLEAEVENLERVSKQALDLKEQPPKPTEPRRENETLTPRK